MPESSQVKLLSNSSTIKLLLFRNELLIDGFSRNLTKKYRMNVPFAIIKLIGMWHLMEYIHIMNKCGYIQHKMINVDKVLDLD